MYLSFILAATALKGVGVEVGNGDKTTKIAHVDTVGIRNGVESLMKELGCSMGDLTVPFHLAKPQTTITVRETPNKKKRTKMLLPT